MLLKNLGKYEIKNWLGGGRFGDVFLARDTLLEQDFALKICRMRPEEIAMLKDEARLLASLDHPNIVRFFNIDIIEGKFVLVMEYVNGQSLREIIRYGGIEFAKIFMIGSQVLEAVDYAHRMNVLHRDLKPENILINSDGAIKITDFGLARFIKSGSIAASTAGTPIYMAPETWKGTCTSKSDVWSIGVILYELLTGTPPFLDDSLEGLKKKIEHSKLLTPGILRSRIPDVLENCVIKTLNPDPRARPEAAEILKKLTKDDRGTSVMAGVSPSLPDAASAKKVPVLEPTQDQRDIIDTPAHRILVLGQAGCGKTATLIWAIAKRLGQNVPLSRMLICTFTNKAANDIKLRIEEMLNTPCYEPWLGTFHTICYRILRREAPRLDISEDFTVVDPKFVYRHLNEETGKHRMQAIMKFIDLLKARGVTPDAFKPQGEWETLCRDIYVRYQQYLKDNDMLDFDDLILSTVQLFECNPDLRELYQQTFEYIFVDEFQDINPVQYQLIRLLMRENLFVTGDEDQAIYGWRGADQHLLTSVAREIADMRIYTLARSFRLPQAIVDAANNLMMREPTMIPSLESGDVTVYAAKSEEDEAAYVTQELKNLKKEGYRFRDCAVLYRMNYLSKLYEEAFATARVPYDVMSGASANESDIVRNLIDYIEMLVLGRDDLTEDDFVARAQALFLIRKKDAERAKELFKYHWQNAAKLSAGNVVMEIEELTGIKDQGLEKLEELAKAGERVGLARFLTEQRLMQELDMADWTKDTVKLLTVHGAKGLEFPVVFIVDLVEDIFPMTKSATAERELEEERRLCYVAVTRAQKKLILLYPKYRYGRAHNPSRFLIDMFKKRA
ncbi:MAG TPA: UvrD-helicase domain-containing protein [bacterium]